MPRVTRTSGPRQHVDARMAASPPENKATEPARLDCVAEGPDTFNFGVVEAAEPIRQHESCDLNEVPPPAWVICSSRARRIRSRDGKPLRTVPSKYVRQLMPKLLTLRASGSMSKPLMRTLGEPRKPSASASAWERTSTSRISLDWPFNCSSSRTLSTVSV